MASAKSKAHPEDHTTSLAGEHSRARAHVENKSEWFNALARECARLAGKPAAFLVCVALVVTWGMSGPLFHYSDTWQLAINTSTTIVTFLMVFLIQNTQNRDTMALQIKLAELIRALHGAENRLAAAEDLSEHDLELLHEKYRNLADRALNHLETRRRNNDA